MQRSKPFKVKPLQMKSKLQRLGELATLHPDRKVREGLKDVIQTIHNKHVQR